MEGPGGDFLTWFRTEIRTAKQSNVGVLAKNARALVTNVLQWVEPSDDCRREGETAVAVAKTLGEEIERAMIPGRGNVDFLQEEALAAVDRLEKAMDACPPSSMARALGV